MKKSKTQKGITLIALIITIIVLLILAVVAIGAVQNDGIIQHAKNAREEYQLAQTNEQTTLSSYLEKINQSLKDETITKCSECNGVGEISKSLVYCSSCEDDVECLSEEVYGYYMHGDCSGEPFDEQGDCPDCGEPLEYTEEITHTLKCGHTSYDSHEEITDECAACFGTGIAGAVICSSCEGAGGWDALCDKCDGEGSVECTQCEGNGYLTCDSCDGEGGFEITCSVCGGQDLYKCTKCGMTCFYDELAITDSPHEEDEEYIRTVTFPCGHIFEFDMLGKGPIEAGPEDLITYCEACGFEEMLEDCSDCRGRPN